MGDSTLDEVGLLGDRFLVVRLGDQEVRVVCPGLVAPVVRHVVHTVERKKS